MKKFLLSIPLFLLLVVQSYAQLPDDFIAPDFTVTDLDGNQHNLYEILDQGKTVIVDIYATWCGPCWDFHNQHVLADIWEELGPNGTDEVFVMSIESDLTTTLDDLNGNGTNTLGDWVTDTPYPMIDEVDGFAGVGNIAQDYFVWGYPTIYFICPSRSVIDLNWQQVEQNYASTIQSCPETQLVGSNNIRLSDYIGIEGAVCEAETFAPEFTFRNLGTENVKSATFSFTINENTENYSWEGDLKPYYTEQFELPTVTAASSDVIITVSDVNGVPDDFMEDNTIESSILVPLETEMDTITVEIMTDDYGAETYWAIFNEQDEMVADGGNVLVGLDVNVENSNLQEAPADPSAYDSETLYKTDVYLPSEGCYKFVIADFYLDGICCAYGQGYYNVISSDNGIIVEGDGDFNSGAETPFSKSELVSVKSPSINDLKTFPNPVGDELNLSFDNSYVDLKTINIFDLQGKRVIQYSNIQRNSINVGFLNSGMYLIQITLADGNTVQKKFIKD